MGKAGLLALLWMILAGGATAQGITRAELWGAVSAPAPGPVRIIGGAGLGCIAGAVQLPDHGPGWQAVNTSRNRHWGHPAMIAWLEAFAARARAAGFPDLWMGDISQPRGGPMSYGHASHQAGIDADIWLDLSPKPLVPPARREGVRVASLVLPGGSGVDPHRFTERHAALIRLAAEQPGLDRLLVNAAIKRELCRRHAGEPWLRRVRPWWGHDSHMHIRLPCPAASTSRASPAATANASRATTATTTTRKRSPPPNATSPIPRPRPYSSPCRSPSTASAPPGRVRRPCRDPWTRKARRGPGEGMHAFSAGKSSAFSRER